MGFLFFPVMPMGLRWAALRAAGAPLLYCVCAYLSKRARYVNSEAHTHAVYMHKRIKLLRQPTTASSQAGVQSRSQKSIKYHGVMIRYICTI